jgi:hypothetical protein
MNFLEHPAPATQIAQGTDFNPSIRETGSWWLNKYSTIMNNFDEYVKAGQGAKNAFLGGPGSPVDTSNKGWTGGLTEHRAPRIQSGQGAMLAKNDWQGTNDPTVMIKSDQPRQYAAGKRCRFFANRDHRRRFRFAYPSLAHCLCQAEEGDASELVQALTAGILPANTDATIVNARADFIDMVSQLDECVVDQFKFFLAGVIANWG